MDEQVEDIPRTFDTGLQLDVFEHLAELRTRLVRSLVYAIAGTIAGWFLYDRVFKLLSAPVASFLQKHGSSFLLTGITEGFTLKMQVSVLVGLIIAMPLITSEAWGFVAPGLTRNERRGVILVAPLSAILFVGGVLAAYFVLPAGITWLAAQNPPGAKFMPSVQGTLLFVLKMCLAFGVVFQMPVVLMFLGKIGLVTSKGLKAYWRHAFVIISIVAAVVTPSNDAFTMLMMCAPMLILYLLSIGLVRLVERRA